MLSESNPVRLPLFLWKLTLADIFLPIWLKSEDGAHSPMCRHRRLLSQSCQVLPSELWQRTQAWFEKNIGIGEPQ